VGACFSFQLLLYILPISNVFRHVLCESFCVFSLLPCVCVCGGGGGGGGGGVIQQVRKAIGGMSVLSSFEFNILCKFNIYYVFFWDSLRGYWDKRISLFGGFFDFWF